MADSVLSFTILGRDRVSPTLEKVGRSLDRLHNRLDRFGNVSAASLAVTAGAAVTSAAAIGAALAGIPVLFGAIGAAALASNTEVRAAYAGLGGQLQAELTAAAAPLAPVLVEVANQVGASAQRMQGQLRTAFAESAPHILTLAKAATDFAENAMPGVVEATRRAGPAMEGLRQLSASTGAGLSSFLKEISTSSASAGTVLASLGRIVDFTLGRLGGLLAQLAGVAAAYMPQIERFVINVINVVTRLASGALPVFGGAIGATLTILNGLLVILEPIAGSLGALAGVIVTAGLAWRVWSSVSSVLLSVGTALQTYAAGLATAMPATAAFATRAGALLATLAGPLGFAIAAVTIGLGLLGASQESAGEKAQKHKSFVEALTAALRESGGVSDANARKQTAQTDAVKEAIDAGKQFGIASNQIVDAALGQGSALDMLRSKLQAVIDTNKVFATDEFGNQNWTGTLTARGQEAQNLLNKINDLNKGAQEAASGQRTYAEAIASSGRSMLESTASGTALAKAIKTLRDTAADADSRARALKDALDALNGNQLSFEESQAKVNEQLLRLGDLFDKNISKADGWGKALLNTDGSINTMTKNGQSLQSTLIGLRDSTAETAQRAYDLAINAGKTVPDALTAAGAVVQNSRDRFVDLAGRMGMTRDQAIALADRMGLIPSVVQTAIQTPGMSETQQQLLLLKAKFDAVPGQKSIVVQSLTQEAQAALEAIGYKVTRLPNGQVRVDALTENAERELDILTRPRTVTVRVTTSGTVRSLDSLGRPVGMAAKAQGGILAAYASGGIHPLTPMRGGYATVVPPGTWRVIGDNLTHRELFAPLDGSQRSWDLIGMGIEEMAARSGGMSGRSGGGVAERHYHLTIQNAGGSGVDVQAQFRRMEMLDLALA